MPKKRALEKQKTRFHVQILRSAAAGLTHAPLLRFIHRF
jgi:hypothetical protein